MQKLFRVVLTKRTPPNGLERLVADKRLRIRGGKNEYSLPSAKLKRLVRGADVILSMLTDRIDAGVMDAAGKNLKIIANYAVGFNNIDIAAAQKRGIIVTNTPGGVSRAVAEHAWALAFACAKRIVEADTFVRKGAFHEWTADTMTGNEWAGKTLGVVGFGRIGEQIAEIGSRGFGMTVLYSDTQRNAAFEKKYGARKQTLSALLAASDLVVLAVPLLPTTHHLIDAKALQRMKRTAIVINIARGPVIDERALVQALRSRQIAAAGLDVFENEPQLAPGLTALPNVVLTPHSASATHEARRAMGEQVSKSILAALAHRPVPNRIR